jgi:hypothetical protein
MQRASRIVQITNSYQEGKGKRQRATRMVIL